ncbi:MAG TPA: SCO family protein [Tepidisphaeraceae bacterium]
MRNISRLLLVALMLALAPTARALPSDNLGGSTTEQTPSELRDITIDEKSGATLPLDTPFLDEKGKAVTLGDYFHKDRPVVLQLSYFGCPMLCTVVSQGLVDSLNDLTLTMGKDFEVVNISFDATETPQLAAEKKTSFLMAYNRPAGAENWHFLTGAPDSVKAITEATGFHYKWIARSKQFSHPAALILLTPDGKISRYLYGVKYDAKTLRLSLVEASQGKIGSTMDRILLTCFHYDSYAGKYTPAAMNIMRSGGVLTVLLVSSLLFGLVRRELRHRREQGVTG